MDHCREQVTDFTLSKSARATLFFSFVDLCLCFDGCLRAVVSIEKAISQAESLVDEVEGEGRDRG